MNWIVLEIAMRNLFRRGRKNLVVAILIAVSVAAFFVGNAVLESSVGGITRTFSDSLTADLSVSEHSEQSISLFGSDIPVIGEYGSLPVLLNAADVGARIAAFPGVAGTAYVLSSPILVEAAGSRDLGTGMGVIGDEYFSLFRGVHFKLGAAPAADSSGWVVITEEWASRIQRWQGQAPVPGDKIQLSFFRNQTFTIREATLAGVIQYQAPNTVLSRIVIVDGRILRALCGFSQTDAVHSPTAGMPGSSAKTDAAGDVDSLFSDAANPATVTDGGQSVVPLSLQDLKNMLSEAHRKGTGTEASALDHSGAWHFILVRTAPGADKSRIAAALKKELNGAGFLVQIKDWRGTMGGLALYVYMIQLVLFTGFFMIGGIVLILMINSVVMSVFERTAEIGTMRAIGVPRAFIRWLFVAETSALTMMSAVAGILLGSAAIVVLDFASLQFNNGLLALLFGGVALHPAVSVGNVLLSAAAALVLGTVAWVYPVRLALRIPPVRAIQAT